MTKEAQGQWQEIATAPDKPLVAILFTEALATANFDGADYRHEIAFWSGTEWREQGTNHSVDERKLSWGGHGDMPTHWMPLPPPPVTA